MGSIEKGCTAIFVGLRKDIDLNGCFVEVLSYEGGWSELSGEDHWLVHCSKINRSGPVRERNLMRIDGLKGDKSISEDRRIPVEIES